MRPMLLWAVALVIVGYGLSCGTRLFDTQGDSASTASVSKLAAQPVLPGGGALKAAGRRLAAGGADDLLAEPPFIPPPHPPGHMDQSHLLRQWNYWMMSQRAGTISYQVFAAGFSLAVFALFYALADRAGLCLGVLRTFGTNALLAYVLHMPIGSAVSSVLPSDSPPHLMWVGCAVCVGSVYLIVRQFERRQIYIRL